MKGGKEERERKRWCESTCRGVSGTIREVWGGETERDELNLL